MIRKYRYGTPFDTEALIKNVDSANGEFPYGKISLDNGFDFTYIMDGLEKRTVESTKEDIVISAIVQMSPIIRKTSALCMARITLLL